MTRVTDADIAAASGLSRTTVSLALNDHPRVAAATKEYVREVATRLGHHKVGASDKQFEILIIVPEGSPDRGDLCTLYLRGMAEAAETTGARCMPVSYTGTDASKWVLDHHLRGSSEMQRAVVVTGRYEQRQVLIQKAQAAGYPVVALFAAEQRGLSVVRTDEAGAAEKAVRFLAQCGVNRLAFLGDTRVAPYMTERRQGVLQTAHKLGIDAITCTVSEGERKREAEQLPAELTDADTIVAGSPSLALFCLARLQEAGIQAPEQTQLISFDHSPRAENACPSITTVGFDARLSGRLAIEAAVKLLQGEVEQSITVIPSFVVKRKSTRPPLRNSADEV